MRVAVFDTHKFDREALEGANQAYHHDLQFFEMRLTAQTAGLARGYEAVCSFANDCVDAKALGVLKEGGVKLIALRCAGFNHVDVAEAQRLGLKVVRVPEYSPYAVAEHAAALLLSFNRKIPKAYNRVRELNFSLDGLVGFDLHGKTVGVIGTGRIGRAFAQIMKGMGCEVLAYDLKPNPAWAESTAINYSDLPTLLRQSQVISLHTPLTPSTRHLIDKKALAQMRPDAVLINTGRGALIDTHALIEALKAHRLGGACLDVYEEEEGVFFSDRSESGIDDDLLARLLTFPNVLITSHQAFLTHEALAAIAGTTLRSVAAFAAGEVLGDVEVTK